MRAKPVGDGALERLCREWAEPESLRLSGSLCGDVEEACMRHSSCVFKTMSSRHTRWPRDLDCMAGTLDPWLRVLASSFGKSE